MGHVPLVGNVNKQAREGAVRFPKAHSKLRLESVRVKFWGEANVLRKDGPYLNYRKRVGVIGKLGGA